MMRGPINGKHVAAMLVGFFGVVAGVNLFMASAATSTFGGIVVENSYVASQAYNGWLEQARADRALGWSAVPSRTADGKVHLALTGVPAGADIIVQARHPLGRMADRSLTLAATGQNSYISREALPPGRWTLRMEIQADGESWRHEEDLR